MPLGSAVAASFSQRPARATSTPRSTLQQQQHAAHVHTHVRLHTIVLNMPLTSTRVSSPQAAAALPLHALALASKLGGGYVPARQMPIANRYNTLDCCSELHQVNIERCSLYSRPERLGAALHNKRTTCVSTKPSTYSSEVVPSDPPEVSFDDFLQARRRLAQQGQHSPAQCGQPHLAVVPVV